MHSTGATIVNIIAYLLSAAAVTTYGAQIFALAPMNGQSHWNVMDAVLQTLVSAGHNVTAVTPFMKKEKIENYTQIDSSVYLTRSAALPFDYCAGDNGIWYLIKTHQTTCKAVYESKQFWTALKSIKYDLFITQLLGSGCDSYIAHELRVPMIVVTTSAMPSWLIGYFGNPLITSYTSTLFARRARPETFFDRLSNGYDYVYTNALRMWHDGDATTIGRTYFNEHVPDAGALMANVSLVFVNSHFAFDLPRPWMPNLIEIGGIHVTDPDSLPEDIQRFIDDAPDGVIYFSFGSTIKMNTLPAKMQSAFQEAFAELPQRILWKYDGDVMPNRPENVMIKKWFPQRDIMAHPNLKLFVYHGGLSGINEAIVNQVPVLGVPLFADQYRNIANAVYLGIGLSLDYKSLNKQSVLTAVKEIIYNKRYKENVQRLYGLYKDRPMSPKALVAYWTDYVIKHNGAKHMRTTAADLYWYQYHQLDVIFFVMLISTSVLVISLYATRKTINIIVKCIRFNKTCKAE